MSKKQSNPPPPPIGCKPSPPPGPPARLPGQFKAVSLDEVAEAIAAGRGGRIITSGTVVIIRNRNDSGKRFWLEAIFKSFIIVRPSSDKIWSCGVGEEVTIKECSFVIREIHSDVVLLEGVAPERLMVLTAQDSSLWEEICEKKGTYEHS